MGLEREHRCSYELVNIIFSYPSSRPYVFNVTHNSFWACKWISSPRATIKKHESIFISQYIDFCSESTVLFLKAQMGLFDLVPFLWNWISLPCFHKVDSWFSSPSLVIKKWKWANFSSISARSICVYHGLRVLEWEKRDSSTVKVTALLLDYLWWVGT